MSMIGKTLGNFEITTALGRGGMGEVYRAKDLKLGRDVAIKVLPEEFAKDADRVARFQREAKLLASLNHPNIAAIHGLEESSGIQFLVLELVEGETLAERLKRGPIPVEESLKLALQIAEALEAAHEKCVIHRDLKPANIKVTPDGKVKVLDFGLAKAFAREQADLNLSNSPTLSNAATQQGVILGTAAYMSPEQAKGKTVDKRADTWAFGVVLFEIVTGRQLFTGETISETLAAVLLKEPNFSTLPPNLHPRIRFLLERCLEKEPKNRYHDIADVRADIQKVLADPSGVLMQPVAAARPRRKLQLGLPWFAAAVLISLLVAGVAVWKLKPSEPLRVVRFDYELPEGQQFTGLSRQLLAVSPDGSQFVYSTRGGLYLRSLDQPTARLIPGTDERSLEPLFSPDGKWICYWSAKDNQLKKIATSGGAPVTLCSAQEPRRPTWGFDKTIVYVQGQGIMQISSDGGTPELLIKAEGKPIGEPQILPDGKAVIFSLVDPGAGENKKIAVQSLKSGERKELFAGDSARYLPTGHIVYSLGNDLFAIPFDVGRLEVKGEPVSMLEGVLHRGLTSAHSQYAISDSGMLLYAPGTTAEAGIKRTLVWVDRKGREEPLAATPDAYSFPRISPDGTFVALTVGTSADSDIWVWNLIHKTLTRLTFDRAVDMVPLWTLDGKRIVYASSREGNYSVSWKAADGTGKIEPLSSLPGASLLPWSWSEKGKTIILQRLQGGSSGSDIGVSSMEGDRKWKPLLQEKHAESHPQISANGRWMAYTSNESDKNEVYVRPFPEIDGGRWQISTSGGEMPLWAPDGRELFYRNGDAIMAVSVKTDPGFSHETPKILFRGTYSSRGSTLGTTWDISPDGSRFLMMKEPESAASAGAQRISIVLNWFEELKQRVPVK